MILLILEALLALLILFGIVWWTMFSGRSKGEVKSEVKSEVKGEFKIQPEPKTQAEIQDEKHPSSS